MSSGEIPLENIVSLVERLKSGDRRAVARLITLIENGGPEIAREIISRVHSHGGQAYIIGVTGAPGSGKSTLTNVLATEYLKAGKKVSVVAVDPTSPFSGGAILGDRIRMKTNFNKKKLFIRSMANRGQLGGLALTTKDVVSLLDAYGSDIIIIETVGVGQSEIDIFKMAHSTLVLVVPGMGDDIQAIKAGIMEITDIFIVNKADRAGAEKRVNELTSMLDLAEKLKDELVPNGYLMVKHPGWRPPIIKTVATTGENVLSIVEQIEKHKKFLLESDFIKTKLNLRYKYYTLEILKYYLSKNIEQIIFSDGNVNDLIKKIQAFEEGSDPYTISDELVKKYLVSWFK